MKYADLFKDGVSKEQSVVFTGRNNVLVVSGITDNGTLKFEVSVDGGTTWVEDSTLEFTTDGTKVLHNVSAMIRVKTDDVDDTSDLLVQIGY